MDFITHEQALSIIGAQPLAPMVQPLPITKCMNYVLAEDVVADRDFPPFDRVTMDGIAIRHAAFAAGRREFRITGIGAAGAPQKRLEKDEDCIEIMTGAMLPLGADTVIRYEDLDIREGVARVMINDLPARKNVHEQGQDRQTGDVLIPKGTRLGSAELSIAATVGKTELKMVTPPLAAVISTGDELVPIRDTPKPYQIRRSNGIAIQAALQEWGVESALFHLPDDRTKMREALTTILLEHRLLILSGGVSKGKFDYLPEVLADLGIQKHFHRIQQRPGKPLWFGTREANTVVFALPGNPVSSYMCTHIYVRHWIATHLEQTPKRIFAALAEPISFSPKLTYFVQCQSQYNSEGHLLATPIKGNGSGDFASLTEGDGFLTLPPDRTDFEAGEAFPYTYYRTLL